MALHLQGRHVLIPWCDPSPSRRLVLRHLSGKHARAPHSCLFLPPLDWQVCVTWRLAARVKLGPFSPNLKPYIVKTTFTTNARGFIVGQVSGPRSCTGARPGVNNEGCVLFECVCSGHAEVFGGAHLYIPTTPSVSKVGTVSKRNRTAHHFLTPQLCKPEMCRSSRSEDLLSIQICLDIPLSLLSCLYLLVLVSHQPIASSA